MPWCDPCERFLNPNTLSEDGSCPACGGVLGSGGTPLEGVGEDARLDAPEDSAATVSASSAVGGSAADPAAGEVVPQRIPWHFWLLVAATAGYLIWRFVQLIVRLL